MPSTSRRRGSLVVVGSGIRIVGQLTVEAIAHIRAADRVLFVVTDSVAEMVVERLNPGRCDNLADFYATGRPRIDTYHAMAGRILECVRSGLKVCVVAYGHPGVFAYPTHEAIRRARAEGYDAAMLPGISAEDCLFADLGLDPAASGCVSIEATDYLIRHYRLDPALLLILWQIGIIGVQDKPQEETDRFGLPLLVERLTAIYPADHPVTIYRAAMVPGQRPFIRTVPLGDLAGAEVPGIATLCVPPLAASAHDHAMIGRLVAARSAAHLASAPVKADCSTPDPIG